MPLNAKDIRDKWDRMPQWEKDVHEAVAVGEMQAFFRRGVPGWSRIVAVTEQWLEANEQDNNEED